MEAAGRGPPVREVPIAPASRHQIEWAASGLRRAASEAGVNLSVDYSRTVAADGLSREPELGVTRLGVGVVIHTSPESIRRLPLVLGYAERPRPVVPRRPPPPRPARPACHRRSHPGCGDMNCGPDHLPTPARMQLTALRDPLVETHGHRPGSTYLEHVYLGILGPSATWLWQRTARIATTRPSSTIDMVDLAASLGLGQGLGPNAAISRTLARLAWFDAARRAGDTLAVRLALPDVPVRRQARLSASARLAHQVLAAANRTPSLAGPGDALTPAVGL